MKSASITLACFLAAGLVTAEETPVTTTPEATPIDAALNAPAAPETPASVLSDDMDEIDLDEIDDAALAARRTQIKPTVVGGPISLVDIDCDDATIADILRQFRRTTGANIISCDSSNLMRRVSVTLRRVPWLQALTSILNSRSFRLDERDGIYRVVEDVQTVKLQTKTFQLNHAGAADLTELFNQTYAPKKDGKILHPIATCFDAANVVVVTADEKTISDCTAIVKAVDKAVAQIYIEARFLELSSEALHKLGVQWDSLQSWKVSAKNLQGGWQTTHGDAASYGIKQPYTAKNMVKTGSNSSSSSSDTSSSSSSSDTYTDLSDGSTSIGNSIIAPASIGAAEKAGLTAADMAWQNARGFSGQFTADEFSLALSAFESLNEGHIFSNPRIIVSNGKKAEVDMTTKEPNVAVEANYTGTSSQNMQISTKLEVIPGEDKLMFAKEAFFSWGISLSVKPRISPDGLISVEIVPTISDKTSDKVITGASSDAVYTTYPIISVKRLTTEFTMKDGATAVIGGLTRTTEEDVDSGIPYLRKIPWIGPWLFGWKSREKVQSEIIVCVTVGIANPADLPRDIGLPKNAIYGREYISGKRLEPGDRTGTASEVLALDMELIDERNRKRDEEQKKKDQLTLEAETGLQIETQEIQINDDTLDLEPGEVKMSVSSDLS